MNYSYGFRLLLIRIKVIKMTNVGIWFKWLLINVFEQLLVLIIQCLFTLIWRRFIIMMTNKVCWQVRLFSDFMWFRKHVFHDTRTSQFIGTFVMSIT